MTGNQTVASRGEFGLNKIFNSLKLKLY